MEQFGSIISISLLTIIIIIILCLPRIIKRNPHHIDFRFLCMLFLAIITLITLATNKSKVTIYFYKKHYVSTHILRALFLFYLSPLVYSSFKLIKHYKRQTLYSFPAYFWKEIRSIFNKDTFIQLFLYSAIEEIIFRVGFCNFLLNSGFTISQTVLIAAGFYSISKLYYLFTSPAYNTKGMTKLIYRTLYYMFTSFIFGAVANYSFCKSFSFFHIYIMNAYYNLIDNPLCLNLWNAASRSPFQVCIRLTLAFGYIYVLSIILMFATSDE